MSRFDEIEVAKARSVQADVAKNVSARSKAFNIGPELDDLRAEIRSLITPHIDEIMSAIVEKLFAFAPVAEALDGPQDSETAERGKAHFLEKLEKPIDSDWIARCGEFGTFAVSIGMPTYVALSTIHAGYEKCLELVIREGHPDQERFVVIAQVIHRLTSLECEAVVAVMHEQLKKNQDEHIAKLSSDFNSEVGKSVTEIDRSAGRASGALSRAVQLGSAMQSTCNDVAASVHQSATAMEEAAKASASISNAVTSLRQVTQDGKERASQGAEKAEDALANLNKLQDASRDVGKIVKLIGDIADQTNILALNATIEAARAGPEGAGFGVVASEVKELAQRVSDATMRVTQNVAIIQEVAEVIDESGRGSSQIMTEMSRQSAMIFEELDRQSDALTSIASAIDETAAVARLSTEHLSRMTDQSADVSDEIGAVQKVISEVGNRVEGLKQGAQRFTCELEPESR
ncbi:MAG: methyl-accepting chemotaxis protein [Erythrobacter sp.]